jgi:hypothetical protein
LWGKAALRPDPQVTLVFCSHYPLSPTINLSLIGRIRECDLIEDCQWELAILATVHGFYQTLLKEYFRGEIPVPAGLDRDSLADSASVKVKLEAMRRWLLLLDMAITPAMIRTALTPDTDPEIAEAMLRYYSRKDSTADVDRDRTDLVATFLYRHPRVRGQWESRGVALDGSHPTPPFEIALMEILADSDVPPLTEHELRLLSKLEGLRQRVEGIRDFDALLDSGVIPKAREVKKSLGASFYHPSVLAQIAPCNVALGKRFDELFLEVSAQIKKFARTIERQGGNIVAQVDGVDVTVDLVKAMDEEDVLKTDYGISLDRFHRVSRLRKLIQSPRRTFTAPVEVWLPPGLATRVVGGDGASAAAGVHASAMAAANAARQLVVEENRLRTVEGAVRAFVRAANPQLRHIVPMRGFNLSLSEAETEAFSADRIHEEGFQGECARLLVRMVAIAARMSTELEYLRQSASPQWTKVHSDSLALLLQTAGVALEKVESLSARARDLGLEAETAGLKASAEKLRARFADLPGILAEFAVTDPESSAAQTEH